MSLRPTFKMENLQKISTWWTICGQNVGIRGGHQCIIKLLAIWHTLVQGHTQDDYNQNGLDCWDECIFEQADDSKSTSALSMLYDIINRVRHLRIFDGVSLRDIFYNSHPIVA